MYNQQKIIHNLPRQIYNKNIYKIICGSKIIQIFDNGSQSNASFKAKYE